MAKACCHMCLHFVRVQSTGEDLGPSLMNLCFQEEILGNTHCSGEINGCFERGLEGSYALWGYQASPLKPRRFSLFVTAVNTF